MFESSQVYGIYGYDEAEKRKEIRLILPEYNRMLLCSVNQGGKALKCFSAVQKKYNEIKDKDRAIKLACKFVIGDTKAPKNCDDASLLRQFLKEDFETRTYIKDILPPPPHKLLEQYSHLMD